MSREQVKAVETAKVEKEDQSVLAYSGSAAGHQVLIVYFFTDDKLARAKYVVLDRHTNDSEYIVDFETLRSTLTEKYGEPLNNETLWLNDLYRKKPQQWGTAVAVGHLLYSAEWETGRTSIFLGLSGDNFKVKLVAEYTSKELRPLEKEQARKKVLSDF